MESAASHAVSRLVDRGGLGAGAILGAVMLPWLRQRFSINLLIAGGTILFAAVTATLALVRLFVPLCVAMVFGGIAWMTLMSGFNIGAQTIVPAWVRARALAIYLLVFFGGMALGSAFWGAVAGRAGMPSALLCAAAALLLGLVAAYFFPLRIGQELNLDPSLHWSDPAVVTEPHPEDGPVLVLVEYEIDPSRAEGFIKAIQEVKRILRRDGASRWGLFKDPAHPSHYVETFLVESWAEHMRQHVRVTNEDRVVQERARSFHVGDSPPVVTHLIAEKYSRRNGRK